MKLPRIVRQIGKRVVKASPILRRHIMSSSDHRVLGGVEEARSVTASSGGWLAARTVARQERAYRRLIADMKRGEPRIDFRVAAEAVAATGITHPQFHAAARRHRLYRHRLFASHDRPCPHTLSFEHL